MFFIVLPKQNVLIKTYIKMLFKIIVTSPLKTVICNVPTLVSCMHRALACTTTITYHPKRLYTLLVLCYSKLRSQHNKVGCCVARKDSYGLAAKFFEARFLYLFHYEFQLGILALDVERNAGLWASFLGRGECQKSSPLVWYYIKFYSIDVYFVHDVEQARLL